MSDAPESPFPFASFSPTGGFDMLEKMWRMMQVPGAGGPSAPASMMSHMMAPMTNIDELDKRITDMRAVEQWLKLNLNLLQSAIQALEVQRATLATLKAFGAFAQTSMEQAGAAAPDVGKAFGAGRAASGTPAPQPPASAAHPQDGDAASAPQAGAAASEDIEGGAAPLVDAAPWWNLLQAQFNQIAAMALAAAPGAAAAQSAGPADLPRAASARASARTSAAQAAAKKAAGPAGKKAGIKKTHASTTGPDVAAPAGKNIK